MVFNYWKVGRAPFAKKVENGSCLSVSDMILTFESPVQSRGVQCVRCASQSPGLPNFPLIWENFLRETVKSLLREGLCAARQGKYLQSYEVPVPWKEGRILEHGRAFPLPVFFYFLSCFLDEIPVKSLLCGGESVGMLCAYSLDFKILMHKEGLTVRPSDSVQPNAFLLNLFYVQC